MPSIIFVKNEHFGALRVEGRRELRENDRGSISSLQPGALQPAIGRLHTRRRRQRADGATWKNGARVGSARQGAVGHGAEGGAELDLLALPELE